MRIWWCQEHEAMSVFTTSECSTATYSPTLLTDCRMISMRLVPDNALTALVKLVKVEYPADRSLTDIARTWGPGDGLSAEQIQALVALDGETP